MCCQTDIRNIQKNDPILNHQSSEYRHFDNQSRFSSSTLKSQIPRFHFYLHFKFRKSIKSRLLDSTSRILKTSTFILMLFYLYVWFVSDARRSCPTSAVYCIAEHALYYITLHRIGLRCMYAFSRSCDSLHNMIQCKYNTVILVWPVT